MRMMTRHPQHRVPKVLNGFLRCHGAADFGFACSPDRLVANYRHPITHRSIGEGVDAMSHAALAHPGPQGALPCGLRDVDDIEVLDTQLDQLQEMVGHIWSTCRARWA